MQALTHITPITYGLLVFALILYGWAARFLWLARQHAIAAAEERLYTSKVDPWVMQRDMMERSAQRIGQLPVIHNGVLLYGALNVEELGETCLALAAALRQASPSDRMNRYAGQWSSLGHHLIAWSREMRERLARIDIGEWELPPEYAKAIFDGTTDLMVTNAGLALAAGMPGAAGYAEVQDSNLSKANPATGVIDKTADGKWIKGVNYREPNLLGTLAQHSPHWATRWGLRKDGTYFAEIM